MGVRHEYQSFRQFWRSVSSCVCGKRSCDQTTATRPRKACFRSVGRIRAQYFDAVTHEPQAVFSEKSSLASSRRITPLSDYLTHSLNFPSIPFACHSLEPWHFSAVCCIAMETGMSYGGKQRDDPYPAPDPNPTHRCGVFCLVDDRNTVLRWRVDRPG